MKTLRPVIKLSLLSLCLVAIIPTTAVAGELESAEHHRVQEEMQRLSGRNAWSGVERGFQSLLELQESGEELTGDDWGMGARAARALGNITDCHYRLSMAVGMSGERELIDLLIEIDAVFSTVRLSTDRTSSAELTPAMMPFVPDQRGAIEVAQASIAETRSFEGLLPAGTYTFGTETFVVVAGGPDIVIDVLVGPSGDGGGLQFAYVGPRANVGAAFTQGGTPSVESGVVSPPAFAGFGARAGVGVEVGMNESMGMFAEIGYHGLSSAVDRSDSDLISTVGEAFSGNQLRTAYLAMGTTYRISDISMSGGLVVGVGVAQATNPDEENVEEMMWITSGTMATAGAQAGLGYDVVSMGDALRGALKLSGGAQHDSQRLYPWAQLSFSVGPVATRSH